jgi:hypothetical protein
MIHPITTPEDFESLIAFEVFLHRKNMRLASNLEIPAKELLTLSTPNWEANWPQGVILLFVPQDITDEPDPESPVGKKIVPRPNTAPTLSRFIAGMCPPFCFITEGVMKAGTVVWVHDPDLLAA